MSVVTVHIDFGAQENEFWLCLHIFPIYLPWSDRTRYHDLFFECWVLTQLFHSSLSPSSRGSLVPLHAIKVVSSAYLKLLIFLLEILIPACDSSSLAFCMMYSAYKLNKQGDSMQPWRVPFPILNQSIVPCPVLTVASWPAKQVSHGQVRWSGIPLSLRIFLFSLRLRRLIRPKNFLWLSVGGKNGYEEKKGYVSENTIRKNRHWIVLTGTLHWRRFLWQMWKTGSECCWCTFLGILQHFSP